MQLIVVLLVFAAFGFAARARARWKEDNPYPDEGPLPTLKEGTAWLESRMGTHLFKNCPCEYHAVIRGRRWLILDYDGDRTVTLRLEKKLGKVHRIVYVKDLSEFDDNVKL